MAEPSAESKAMARDAREAVIEIAAIMVGKSSMEQGNIIAMLLGIWLAGHHIVPKKGEPEEDRIKAERALRAHLMTATTKAAFGYAADQDQTRDAREKRNGKTD